MNIDRIINVPTGQVIIVNGERGKLEMLSLADYGADVNLNQHKPVPDGLPLLPLTKKWVVTISTQYGCSMGCEFCDVPKVGPGKNASPSDLNGQIDTALDLPGAPWATERLNVHFARMGEPTWNASVISCARQLAVLFNMHPHPVVSTMMPRKNGQLEVFIRDWMNVKNVTFSGNAGLQISVNSTDEAERQRMFHGNACSLERIAEIMRPYRPVGRKITLNFAVAGYTVDAELLARLFNPEHFVCKLTPMHKTATAVAADIKTAGDYTQPEPYLEIEDNLKRTGFDVLVFIASRDEDEGRITCGNAILSGTEPRTLA